MNNRHNEVESLNRVFGPIGEVLFTELNLPVFFLALNPTRWAIDYCGITITQNPDAWRKIQQSLLQFQVRRTDCGGDLLDRLARHVEAYTEKGEFVSEAELAPAAASPLAQNSVELGGRVKGRGNHGNRQRDHWAIEMPPADTLKWFQVALDFAYFDKFDRTSIEHRLGNETSHFNFTSLPAIGIKAYMSREGLVTKQNMHFFLAEYLYGRYSVLPHTSHEAWDVTPSQLDHYFLPMSGLGQWRAAACWLQPPSQETSRHFADNRALHSSLRVLCSQALIDAFTSALSRVLSDSASYLSQSVARKSLETLPM